MYSWCWVILSGTLIKGKKLVAININKNMWGEITTKPNDFYNSYFTFEPQILRVQKLTTISRLENNSQFFTNLLN